MRRFFLVVWVVVTLVLGAMTLEAQFDEPIFICLKHSVRREWRRVDVIFIDPGHPAEQATCAIDLRVLGPNGNSQMLGLPNATCNALAGQ